MIDSNILQTKMYKLYLEKHLIQKFNYYNFYECCNFSFNTFKILEFYLTYYKYRVAKKRVNQKIPRI